MAGERVVSLKDVRLGVKTKLFGMIIGTAAIALIAACLTFVVYDRNSYSAAKESTLTVLTDAVANAAFGPVAFQDPESAKYVLRTIASEDSALAAAIYLEDGKQLVEWAKEGHHTGLSDQFKGVQAGDGKELTLARAIEKDGKKVGHIVTVFSKRDVELRTKNFLKLAAQVLVGAILLATLVVVALHRTFTGPVLRLSEAAARVQHEERFDIRVAPSSNDEFGVLTSAFNSMLAAVEHRDAELSAHREGLERTVKERTADLDRKNQAMRLVLDTVDQGLVTLDLSGNMEQERSAQFDRWFGSDPEANHFAKAVEQEVSGFFDRFDIAYEQLADGFMPQDVALGQLPQLMVSSEGRSFEIQYRPIEHEGQLNRVLAIITDVTDQLARQQAEREQKQVIAMFEHIAKDRAGFIEFVTDVDEMVKRVVDGKWVDRADALRLLHTIKGNSALFDLMTVSECCHDIESACFESEALPSDDHRRILAETWGKVAQSARELLGDVSSSLVVDLYDYEEILAATRADDPTSRLTRMVERLCYEAVGPKFARFETQTRRLARRLGVDNLEFESDARGVRLPEGWGWLWSLVPHLLRNAVDHGLGERKAESTPPRITLRAEADEDRLLLTIADNGRGLDWDQLRKMAKEKGLPHATKNDLVRVLFKDEVTTKASATDVSGRGVGLSAVAIEVKRRGGRIEVASEKGRGTTFTISIPFKNSPVLTDRASIQARSQLPLQVGQTSIRAANG